jgi:hypothetical protein
MNIIHWKGGCNPSVCKSAPRELGCCNVPKGPRKKKEKKSRKRQEEKNISARRSH